MIFIRRCAHCEKYLGWKWKNKGWPGLRGLTLEWLQDVLLPDTTHGICVPCRESEEASWAREN